jgi:uncharacterized membrane protein required for colicin V production
VADVVLLVIFGGAFLVGAWRGALRQMLVIGAWLISFLAAAYLRDGVATWLAPQQPDLSWQYNEMVAFLLVFGFLFTLATVIIEFAGTRMDVSKRQWLDDGLGGVLGVCVAILVVGSVLIIFDSYYAGGYPVSLELTGLSEVHAGLTGSVIGQALHNSLVPGLLALGGLLLPANVVHPG